MPQLYLCTLFYFLVSFLQYTVPPPVPYQGTPTDDDSCIVILGNHVCVGVQRLMDGVFDSNDDLDGVHAWDGDTDIILRFDSNVVIKFVNLFFYDDPQATGGPVGLPFVDLAWSADQAFTGQNTNTHPHTILGNQDLSQTDMGYRNVSVVVPMDLGDVQPSQFFRIRLLFPETSLVDWALLSELQVFGDTTDIGGMYMYVG